MLASDDIEKDRPDQTQSIQDTGDKDKPVYFATNEKYELNRLRTQFADIKRVFGGVFDAPVQNDLSKGITVLDSGCGPGTFAIELSKEYPLSSFIGLDLTDVFPSEEDRSPNCEFMIHNILKPLPFPDNHFGLIHQQYLIAGILEGQWSSVLQEFKRTLKPGGWIELTEPALAEVVNIGPKMTIISESIQSLAAGVKISIARELEPQLAAAGFVNIHARRCLSPMVSPEDESEKRKRDFVNGLGTSIRPSITKKHPELSSDAAYNQFLSDVLEEIKERASATPVYRVYGQKPQ